MPCPRFAPVTDVAGVTRFAGQAGWPVVLKAVSGGYDGRGVWVCDDETLAAELLAEVLPRGIALLAEEYVPFRRELAAVVARSPHRQGAAYPVVQTVQRDGVCHEVLAPAPGLSAVVAEEAQRLALEIADALGVTGLLAVELFEAGSGLLVNELAMRPHNSGHWTIEGAVTSQFEQHLRAVLDLPLGAPRAAAAQTVMVNVFGGHDPDLYSRYVHVMAADPGVKVHMYGKAVRPGRKIGHVTVTGRGAADENLRAAGPGRCARPATWPPVRRRGNERGARGWRPAGRGGDGQRLGLAGDGGGGRRAGRVRRALRGRRGVRAPDAARDDRLRHGGGRPRPAGDHRRARAAPRTCPACWPR